MKFHPDTLKNRLIERMGAIGFDLSSGQDDGFEAPAPAARPGSTALPNASARHAAPVAEAAPPAPDWTATLAGIAENLEALGSQVRRLSAKVDNLQLSFQRQRNDFHVDLVHQRLKIQEIAAGLDARMAACERAISSVPQFLESHVSSVRREVNAVAEAVDGLGKENLAREQDIRAQLTEWMAQGRASTAQLEIGVAQAAARVASAEATICSKVDCYAVQVGDSFADVKAACERLPALEQQIGQATAATVASAEATICSKLDGYAANLLAAQETTRQTIRPPVIAAADFLVVRCDHDLVLAMPRTDWVLAAHYAYRDPPRGLSMYLDSALQPGMRFVDVGANIGIHTVRAARRVGDSGMVYSFEPDPETFRALRQNVRANGLERVELFPFAVLDRSTSLLLHRVHGISTWSHLFEGGPDDGSLPVETITLDQALSHVSHIDMIKVDAEGAEPLIWRGMQRILSDNPAVRVIVEFAPIHLERAGVTPVDFLAAAAAGGFHAFRIDDVTGELSAFSLDALKPGTGADLLLQRAAAT